MSEINNLGLSKGIIVKGLPRAEALYTNNGQPWESVEAFLQAAQEDTLVELVPYTPILVNQNGVATEMWNNDPENITTFIPNTNKSSIYEIKASDWNLTKGNEQQDANHHYSDAQYDRMYQNGIGISNAIKYAYSHGFNYVILEKGVYCFCCSSPQILPKPINSPQIFLNGLSNFTFDINGSTLKFCVDDTQYSKYYKYTSRPLYTQCGVLIAASYCRDLKIRNGILIGDRLTRTYTEASSSQAEQTYGISVFGGCKNVNIENIEVREFMGDGIVGGGNTYHIINNASEAVAESPGIGYLTIGRAYHSNGYKEDGSIDANIESCAISDFINVNTLYTSNLNIENRLKDKEDRIFHINFPLGYTRMCSAYPTEIGILTYNSTSDSKPIRKLNSSYLSTFRLSVNENYIKVLFYNENTCYDEYDSSKSYNIGDKVLVMQNNVVCEYESLKWNNRNNLTADVTSTYNNWKQLGIRGVGIATTYDSSVTYGQGVRVKFNIGQAGVCYQCKTATTGGAFDDSKWFLVETDRPCTSYVEHDVVISEFISSDVTITNCRVIDNHRGGIANLPHNSIIKNCQFSKHYHRVGDGFMAPNPGNNLECTGQDWSTQYHIDIEDWYSASVKILDCRFDSDNSNNNKVLLGCLKAIMSGCTGCIDLTIYAATSINISNNTFDGFTFSTVNQSNTYWKNTACRTCTRDIILDNNRILTGYWLPMQQEGQKIRVTNNFIYEDFARSDTESTMFFTNKDFIFTNNTLVESKNKKSSNVNVTINANVVSGSSLETNAQINLFSPMRGDFKIRAQKVFFRESLDKREFSGLDVNTGNSIYIFVNTDPNGTLKKVIKFSDCHFNTEYRYQAPIYVEGASGRNSSQEFDIFFDHCEFTSQSDYALLTLGNNSVNGDIFNLHFNNCTFNVKSRAICSNVNNFTIQQYSNCSSSVTMLYGETELGVGEDNINLEDYYTKAESDAKYQSVGNYLTPSTAYTKEECDELFALKSSSSGDEEDYIKESDLQEYFKTVNGYSIIGVGNIIISATPPDMSQYLTREQIEGAFLRADQVSTINGRSIVQGGDVVIEGVTPSVDTSGTSTAIYPVYRIYLYNPIASPQIALRKNITDFNFESGKTYRIDADFGTGNPYTGLTITLSHSDGTQGEQQVFGTFGQSIHQTFTADDDYDKMAIYYGSSCDCYFTVSFQDTIQNLVNGIMAEDAMTNKENVSKVNEILNLKRKFAKPYKFVCMGDSITSNQVSGIGTLVASYLGCELIDNYAVGSATLANGDNFIYSIDIANNTATPYNTLVNQVVRLLQRTTELNQQITWTHQETGTAYSIPTNVATGLGHTEDIPDIIYIAAGINDSIDNVESDPSIVMSQNYSNLDKKTFASALRWIVETLRAAYPKVQIFVATPLFTGTNDTVPNYNRTAVLTKRQSIINACVANSVYCIDSTMKSGYTNQIAAINSQGIHPRSYYKCMIAKFIQKEIYNNYIPEIPQDEIVY